MRRRVLAVSRARGRALASFAVLGLVLAGCGTTNGNSSVSASGDILSVYLSSPGGTTASPWVHDVIEAEELAFAQHGAEVTAYKLRLHPISNVKLSDSGRAAIENKAAIAYVGEIEPGTSGDSAGITNAQDLLTVSPSDTALEFTQKTVAIPNTPDRYYESLSTYGKTFARVVPNTAREAQALLGEMKKLGVSSVAIADDGSSYGRAMALAMKQSAGAAAVTVAANTAGAGGYFFAGISPAAAVRAFTTAAQANPRLRLFAPSALDNPALVTGLGASAKRLYVSAPGFMPSELTAAGQQFVSDFKAKFGATPAPQAIFGYEAMSAVLSVIHAAGHDANNRKTVVKDFFAIRDRQGSVLGPYSITANGDTTIAPFVILTVKAGALTPSSSAPALG
jgi:ABC-type branched-subunit amino acid transport system substrate-binding protein